uniref:Doublecortin domain-containing protein n=1 Tax=Strongyloides stercoralis TaxID=6248 RepID=A0A0K0E241_STRER
MESKVGQVEKLKSLEKALTLLNQSKKVLSYYHDRSFSHELGENFNLKIEFEIPTDLATETETDPSVSVPAKDKIKSPKPLTVSKNTTSKDCTTTLTSTPTATPTATSTATSTTTSTATSTATSTVTSTATSTDTPTDTPTTTPVSQLTSTTSNIEETVKSDGNYQTLNTISAPIENKLYDVKAYLRTYIENNRHNGVLERYDIELNPSKGTLKDIIIALLPKKDPLQVMRDGVFFTRDSFSAIYDYSKIHKWTPIFPYEMYIPVGRIYNMPIDDDFSISFVIDNVKKKK